VTQARNRPWEDHRVAVTVAILDEPPFCWLDPTGRALGCDVEVAAAALRRAGVGSLSFRQVTFAELIPGLLDGRWQVATGMFVTGPRRRLVRFTRPIWAVPDGLIVRAGDAGRFPSYRDLGADPDARLGVVAGQVQGDSARSAGVPAERIAVFATQDAAVAAVASGDVDAAASTAIGNRALAARLGDPGLVAVDLRAGGPPPVGALSLAPADADLADAVDAALGRYLGGPDHRAVLTRYGFTAADLDEWTRLGILPPVPSER
jgi:polar amino acid transport system substrate-binding protein